MASSAAVEAEDETVEVGLQMPESQASFCIPHAVARTLSADSLLLGMLLYSTYQPGTVASTCVSAVCLSGFRKHQE